MKSIFSFYKCFFCVISILCFRDSLAQNPDSIHVIFDRLQYSQQDTITFDVSLDQFSKVAKTATIQLCIEEISTGRKWNYRYPLINGFFEAKLKIDSTLKDGKYAFNFLLQKKFFGLNGKVKNASEKDQKINYVLLTKGMQTMMDQVFLNEDKTFSLGKLLFQDTAIVFFSRPKKTYNPLEIQIETPLDSIVPNSDTVTQILTIGIPTKHELQKDSGRVTYVFNGEDSLYKKILPAVIVKSKTKKLIDDFERDNVTGVFAGGDATIIDGLESDELAHANDLLTFLSGKVAGLTLSTNEEGERELTWRKHKTALFVNEIKVDSDIDLDVNPTDIALIKIFRPGENVVSGSAEGGMIAIYLKNGVYGKVKKVGNSFSVTGYTSLDAKWK